ncbi:MAG TPA: hypothetical protein VNU72_01285 [Puia sp.]|nr:hypothetical protein [Puia sp.]
MKKTTGLLLLISSLLLSFASCSKGEHTDLTEQKAHVVYEDPATGGIGYYIMVDGSKEKLIPVNLPVGFRVQGMSVAVKFEYTAWNSAHVICDKCKGSQNAFLVSIRQAAP